MDEREKYREIAVANGISKQTYINRLAIGWNPEKAATTKIRKYKKDDDRYKRIDVAMYKGDEFLLWGTVEEVAEKLNKGAYEITTLCAPSIRARSEESNQLYGIYLEDDEYATKHFQ